MTKATRTGTGTTRQTTADVQVIGLGTARLSGIKLSRDAYVDVLRTLHPIDVNDWSTAKGKEYRVNLFASAMSIKAVEQVGPLPGKTIWCVVLESTALPLKALETHDRVDQVWVPTRFCWEVCVRNGMDASKVRLVPYYLRLPRRKPLPPAADAPYTFLTSWDGRSSMNRKFVLGSIEAFRKAFPGTENVRLKLKTRDLQDANVALVREAIGGDERIVLDNAFVETSDELFDGIHAVFHIHRAEGYGRHIVEATQRRVPVITTGYSGNMDWTTRSNALLVNFDLVDTAQQEFQYPQGGKWAEPDVDHAAFQLRYCFQHHDRLGLMTEHAFHDVFRFAGIERSRAHTIEALQNL